MIILIVLFFCHWLADFTHLSTNRMLKAKRFGTPLFPILAHAAAHAGLMGFALFLWRVYYSLPVMNSVTYAILLQWLSHFLIDLWKGKMNVWFPSLQDPANKFHWYIFGFDQFLHTVVIIIMAKMIGAI